MARHHGSLGTAPPGFLESQPGGSKGQRQPPGSLADPHHKDGTGRDNKRNIKRCRSLQAASGRRNSLPGRLLCQQHLGPLPKEHQKESNHRRQKGKDPGPGTALPFILAFTHSPQLSSGAHLPPLTGRSGAKVTAPPRGNSGRASIPILSRGPETPLLSDHLLHPRTAHSSPRRPFLLQRPAHPRPPPGETVPPWLYLGQSPDPHKHLFDLGALAPPLGHLSHSIHLRFTGALAHAPNPLRRPQAGSSPGAPLLRPSAHLAPISYPTVGGGARREPGATRVGPRARRARLTKSGAAPCGRATGDRAGAWASGRDSGPRSDLPRPALPAPVRLSPGPGGLSVPFSRRTRLPLAGAAPADGNPQLRALGAGRRGCRCEPQTAAMTAPVNPPSCCRRLAGLGRGRPARSSTAPRRRRAPRAGRQGACIRPCAPRPAPYPGSRRRGDRPAAAATAAAGRAPSWSAAEGSAAEPRGAAPTMAELTAPSPPPPAP